MTPLPLSPPPAPPPSPARGPGELPHDRRNVTSPSTNLAETTLSTHGVTTFPSISSTGTEHEQPSGTDRTDTLARLISEVTSPSRVMAVVQTLVAFHSCPTPRGALGLATWTAGTTALLPDLFVRWGAARGRWSDRDVSQRHQRTVPILFGLASCVVGLTGLHFLNAPDAMTAAVWAPIASVPFFLAVNHFWTKLSIHVGCLAGGVVVTAAMYGPAALLVGVPALVGTAWSRRKLRHHTLGQMLLGGVIGGTVTAAVYLALT